MGFDPYKKKGGTHEAPRQFIGGTPPPKTVEDVVNRSKVMGIPERGLSPETCQQLGIRVECSEATGKPVAHYFPYCNGDGRLAAYKRVDLLVPKKEDFHFTVVPKGALNERSMLFNQTRCKTGGRKLYVTEGEYDCASIIEAYNRVGNKEFPCPDVTSLGLGTKNAGAHLSHNMTFISSFQMKIGCFDNDFATPAESKLGIERGREAMSQALLLIPDLYDLTFATKDANEELLKGDDKGFQNQILFGAKLFEPAQIVTTACSVDELMTPLKEGVYIEGLPKTMQMLHGLRQSELTLIMAPSGVGKTTLSKHIGFGINKGGHTLGHIFLEEDVRKTQQSYIALACGVPLAQFRANPSIVPREMVEKARADYLDNGRVAWVTHLMGMNPKTLLRELAVLNALNYKYAILDHITQVLTKGASKDKVGQIDTLMETLYEFVESTDMHLIVVSHISRIEKRPPRDKDGTIQYPYWEELPMEAARGSAAFEQYSWNIIALEPERIADRKRGRVRTTILKNREWGELGVADVFHTDPKTGLIINCEDLG